MERAAAGTEILVRRRGRPYVRMGSANGRLRLPVLGQALRV